MKKLSELGISPTPWKMCDGDLERWIEDSDGILVAELGMKNNATRRANVRLFLAAPNLYEELRNCYKLLKRIRDNWCNTVDMTQLKIDIQFKMDVIRAVLANVSDESEVWE